MQPADSQPAPTHPRALQSPDTDKIATVIRRYWGFESLRPLQNEAIEAGINHQDSLVVLPTGGGKSLCYQVPPAVTGRTDVVVSPLISLMKDQVDGLRQCGYPAAALHSGVSIVEQREIQDALATGQLRLLFLSPERLMRGDMLEHLARCGVRAFAIDEAHCISHWGHDFRPEYRQLAILKQRFPEASIHAYTATATQRVRDDVIAELGLHNPRVLVGTFDRPNLIYRVIPRVDPHPQVAEILDRHRNEAAIVYCITRKETEALAAYLRTDNRRAACYHAGLDAETRRRTQEAFLTEQLDVVVATVAFGMGIDRSDVRCVIHAAMPKTIEHYQQESGRAGRDGLEAECVMLYSPADAIQWDGLIRRSAANAPHEAQIIAAATELLNHMRSYAGGLTCRHAALSNYFGQNYPRDNCGACDVCLNEVHGDEEHTIIAQKILSCVARVEQRVGIQHVVKVLTGSREKTIRARGHDQLSVYGLLKDLAPNTLTNLIFQLIEQGVLDRTHDDRPILKLNAASWAVLHNKRPVRLVMPKPRVVRASEVETAAWESVDRTLFERLRELRRQLASDQNVPAYIVFQDATLRAMARRKPQTLNEMHGIIGVGRRKLERYGQQFLQVIRKQEVCQDQTK